MCRAVAGVVPVSCSLLQHPPSCPARLGWTGAGMRAWPVPELDSSCCWPWSDAAGNKQGGTAEVPAALLHSGLLP